MSAEVHQNDIGTIFEYTIYDQNSQVVPLVGYTLSAAFRKPDGRYLNIVPVFSTDGTDGKIRYVAQSGDIDIAGIWRTQAFVQRYPSGWYSNILSFKVFPNV